MAETANEKRIRKEAELDAEKLNTFGLNRRQGSTLHKAKNLVTGEDDFGTSISPGAVDAANRKVKEVFDRGAPTTLGDAMFGDEARQAAREAAAEERREANRATTMKTINKKKGGKVVSASKRADGIAQRGKTRGTLR